MTNEPAGNAHPQPSVEPAPQGLSGLISAAQEAVALYGTVIPDVVATLRTLGEAGFLRPVGRFNEAPLHRLHLFWRGAYWLNPPAGDAVTPRFLVATEAAGNARQLRPRLAVDRRNRLWICETGHWRRWTTADRDWQPADLATYLIGLLTALAGASERMRSTLARGGELIADPDTGTA